jgi:hypothetical protein
VLIAGLALLASVFIVLMWQVSTRSQHNDETLRPAASPPSLEERRVQFIVDQLEKICLSNLTKNAKDLVSAGVRARLPVISADASVDQIDELARGAGKDLPPAERRAESDEIRKCFTDNFPMILSALVPSSQPASHTPPNPTATKKIEPPAKHVASQGGQISTPPLSSTAASKACINVRGLKSLGYRTGHKTNFCKLKLYDGVTNFPGSDYKDHGGGYCYTGSKQACLAQLVGSQETINLNEGLPPDDFSGGVDVR